MHYHRNKCGATLPCFSRYVAAATHASSSPGGTVTEERRPSPRKGRERQHFPQHTSHSTYPLPRAHPILFVHLPPAPDLSTLMHALYELIALKHVECTRLRPSRATLARLPLYCFCGVRATHKCLAFYNFCENFGQCPPSPS